LIYDVEKPYVNAGMPDKKKSGIGISFDSKLPQSGIGILVSGSVRYRWSRISPALPISERAKLFKEDEDRLISFSAESNKFSFMKIYLTYHS
jgi:hypothetical protein